MPALSPATCAVYHGGTKVRRVYHGSTTIWPTGRWKMLHINGTRAPLCPEYWLTWEEEIDYRYQPGDPNLYFESGGKALMWRHNVHSGPVPHNTLGHSVRFTFHPSHGWTSDITFTVRTSGATPNPATDPILTTVHLHAHPPLVVSADAPSAVEREVLEQQTIRVDFGKPGVHFDEVLYWWDDDAGAELSLDHVNLTGHMDLQHDTQGRWYWDWPSLGGVRSFNLWKAGRGRHFSLRGGVYGPDPANDAVLLRVALRS